MEVGKILLLNDQSCRLRKVVIQESLRDAWLMWFEERLTALEQLYGSRLAYGPLSFIHRRVVASESHVYGTSKGQLPCACDRGHLDT